MNLDKVKLTAIAIITNLLFSVIIMFGSVDSVAEAEQASGCGYNNISVLSYTNSLHINSSIDKFLLSHKDIKFLKTLKCGDGTAKADVGDSLSSPAMNGLDLSARINTYNKSYTYTNLPISYNSVYNWSGMAVRQDDNMNNSVISNFASAYYTHPDVKKKADSNVCFWTGLGDAHIIQNGTAVDTDSHSKLTNHFWWEIVDKGDKGMINIQNLPLSANDKVYSSTYWKNGHAYFLMANLLKNIGVSFMVANVSKPHPVAEVITERPTYGVFWGQNQSKNYYKNLLDFEQVKYQVDFGHDFKKSYLYYANLSMINKGNQTLIEAGMTSKNTLVTNWVKGE